MAIDTDGPIKQFGERMDGRDASRRRKQTRKAIALLVIGIVFLFMAFVPDAASGTLLPTWAVDTPPAARTINWSAGCFIPTEGGVVVSINRHGTIQLPFGKAKGADEYPRETAVRETLEETGLTVETHEVVAALAGDQPLVEGDINQSLLYRCTIVGEGFINYEAMDATEVAEALVIDPVTMRTLDGKEVMAPWRFPPDRDLLMFLLQPEK